MQAIQCPHCRAKTDESQAGWDRACATGCCPCCGRMLDAALEEKAKLDGSEPAVRSRTRMVRINALIVGIGSLIATSLLLVLSAKFHVWLFFLGLAQVGIAILYDSTSEARIFLKQRTDLSRFRIK